MARALLLVLDSFGIGATPDADRFGDQGANTLGHIAAWCADGGVSDERPRSGPLFLPNLCRLGLAEAAKLVSGKYPKGMQDTQAPVGFYAACAEKSFGKDTPSGHWEMAGAAATFDWGYFPPEYPSFPSELTDALIERAGLSGILGNKAASGTEIIKALGDEHIQTGKPILYTSADSVLQIAAHEDHFGLERLYKVCTIARELVDDYNIGRVIARPFVGGPGHYVRTGNRKDLATPPHKPTLLDALVADGREVVSVGKISDIFAGCGITRSIKATGNDALFEATLQQVAEAPDGSLVFTNFVDFDQEYGHRRNIGGYAAALERFDQKIPDLLSVLKEGDLLLFTADHGCDPSWRGTDHTREYVPCFGVAPGIAGKNCGVRETFADMGQTIAVHLEIPALDEGQKLF